MKVLMSSLLLVMLIFHQVNYQDLRHKDYARRAREKPLPLGEENPQRILLIALQMTSTKTQTYTLDLDLLSELQYSP